MGVGRKVYVAHNTTNGVPKSTTRIGSNLDNAMIPPLCESLGKVGGIENTVACLLQRLKHDEHLVRVVRKVVAVSDGTMLILPHWISILRVNEQCPGS